MLSRGEKRESGRSASPPYIDAFAALAIFVVIGRGLLTVFDGLPRNSDNTISAIYTLPSLALVILVSATLLWKRPTMHRALRMVCKALIALCVICALATAAVAIA